ncbi:hypothetical protein [Kitasatospora sp. NPDC094011]|uniref:hypothetical protein n=1 Tax=Kitasatospora sp. NPDC094011 TaxID=3364090 RepID=UPI0038299A5A
MNARALYEALLDTDGPAEDTPIDGRPDLHPDAPGNLSPEERLLTPAERRELLASAADPARDRVRAGSLRMITLVDR